MYEKDRRLFERFAVDLPAEIKQLKTQKSSLGYCRDISAGGIGLIANEEFTPNTSVEIALNIPSGYSPFRGLARVIWQRQVQENKWRAGLEFQSIDFMRLSRIFEQLNKEKQGLPS